MLNYLKKKLGKKSNSNPNSMGMLQRLAMKKLEKMSPAERQKIMQDAMKPENRDKLIKAMEQMKASGQVTEEQIQLAKKKLGL